jgi:hypothetical protein
MRNFPRRSGRSLPSERRGLVGLRAAGVGATFAAEVGMAVVWSAVCALAALAAGVQQVQGDGASAQMKTRVLPGHGYIRYEVLPGDDQAEAGEVIVVHEERLPSPPAPGPATAEAAETYVNAIGDNAARPRCTGLRAKLLVRIFEMQGMQVEPSFAAWLERNLNLGASGVKTIQLLGGDPLLLTALKVDGVARGLAEDLARCEQQ